MIEYNKKYIKQYVITQNMLDEYDRVTPEAICDIFQDAATRHADILGESFQKINQKGLLWVLLRNKFKIINTISFDDTITCETWTHDLTKFDIDRDYILYNGEGKVMAIGSSKWVFIDLKRRMLAPMSKNYIGDEIFLKESNFEGKFTHLDKFQIPLDERFIFTVNKSDLDHNGHMNNTRYLRYVLDAIKLGKDEVISYCQIDFIKETKYLEQCDVHFAKENKNIYVEIYSYNDLRCRVVLSLI